MPIRARLTPSLPWTAQMSTMVSASPPVPTEAALQSLRDELKGNVFRDVNGLVAKFFRGKPWSDAVENKLHEPKSAQLVSKLAAAVPGLSDVDAVVEWLADFQTLFFAANQANFHFHSHPITSADTKPGTAIYLERSNLQSAAGSTAVFGQLQPDDGPVTGIEDDDLVLRFCGRAKQVFKTQSARCFIHGFLARGSTLELWVFDRSGAYSSESLDLAQNPDLLVRILAGYTFMSDGDAGFNTFVKGPQPGLGSSVAFDTGDRFHLRPELIASADYIVGPGTACYVASTSPTGQPDTAIKLSWREEEEPTELRLLKLAHERKAWGIINIVGYQDLVNIADLRQGLHFPQSFVNRTLSCVASTPLGRPIRQFTSVAELLEVLRDLVKALQSLYVNARILHRDVAIKNLIITPQKNADSPKGVLLDFNFALDLDNARPIEPMVGSDGFMAIGILTGQRHTYRHDLESLFYVFLWIAIANDRVHDEATDIMEGLPTTSKLRKWCTMDFSAVGRDKAADMSTVGFGELLDEFSPEFASLGGLARELHALLFPVRDGKIFTGTDTDQVAVQTLYDGMAGAFHRSSLAFQ